MKFIKKIPLEETTFSEYNVMIMRRKNLLQWLFMAVIIAAAVSYFNFLENLTISILFGVFLGLLFIGLSDFLGAKRARKNALIAHKDKQMQKLHLVYTLNPKGISQKGKTESNIYTWSQIKKIKETKSAFYFFYAKNNAIVLSKKALLEQELITIHSIIKENYSKK